MACIKHICVFSFLLAVVAFHLVLMTEGRQLKALKKHEFHSADNTMEKETLGRQSFTGDTSPVTGKINYTPTGTGNSPGIGHSSSGPKANYQPKHTVEGSVNDLKAGHSPGIGHASQNKNIGPNV